MRTYSISLIVIAFFVCAALGQEDTVETEDGTVVGTVTDNYRSFLGIPYAAPPIGNLRWENPSPVEPWGTLNATGLNTLIMILSSICSWMSSTLQASPTYMP